MANTKKSSSKATKKSVSKQVETKNNNSNVLLISILVLVVLQLVVLFGLVLSQDSELGTGSSDLDERLSNIESKVSAIDSFFASNVDGYNGNTAPSQGNNAPLSNNPEDVDLDIENEPTLGNPDALVTIVEFSDYECPFCQRWHGESYDKLKAEYIDTGKVKLVYKDFPLSFHQNAMPAAIAANCVFDQLGNEAYFEYHSVLFDNQQSLTSSNLKTWALEAGVEEASYDSCIADPSAQDEPSADLAEGSKYGVSGTPSFFINGNLIVGAQPYSVLKETIEAQLQ